MDAHASDVFDHHSRHGYRYPAPGVEGWEERVESRWQTIACGGATRLELSNYYATESGLNTAERDLMNADRGARSLEYSDSFFKGCFVFHKEMIVMVRVSDVWSVLEGMEMSYFDGWDVLMMEISLKGAVNI